MIAALFHCPAPPVDECRVLELGCASGGNLIPMAQDLPRSRFLGIDLSPRQIADGRALSEALGLSNIALRSMDISDLGQDIGTFDYILCHGVYSWVPRPVQDRILEIGRDHLSRNGIMYVSYNTYPGWHLRGVVRDMMRYHAASFSTAEEKLGQSRSLLKFLINSATSASETYRQLLKDEAEHLDGHSDEYIYHEHLEETNEPLYFHQFMDRVAANELRYLGDADFGRMLASQFDDATAAILRDAPLLRQEQYIDFLTARTFRRSLLCHPETPIDRDVAAERLRGLALSLPEQMQALPSPPHGTKFVGQTRSVTSECPEIEAVLRELIGIWPAWITTEELLMRVRNTTGAASHQPQAEILGSLLLLLSRGAILAAVNPPAVGRDPGAAPLTTAWARLQAQAGASVVTNRRHTPVEVDSLSGFVLSHLDGQHDRRSLLDALQAVLATGELQPLEEDLPTREFDHRTLDALLDRLLARLASRALLVPRPS
jgi:SAM-dependent methyltransferase